MPIASLLDSPAAYGVRLEFLDIEMNKDEQLSYFASHDLLLSKLVARMEQVANAIEAVRKDPAQLASLKDAVPLDDLREFAKLLESIAPSGFWGASTVSLRSNVAHLRVPLSDLREFETILNRICPNPFSYSTLLSGPTVAHLQVPLSALREYEETLDRIIVKSASLPGPKAGGA